MAGRFKYANPEILNVGIPTGPEVYTDPVKKAMGVVAPTGEPGTLSPVNTIDDAMSLVNQVNSFKTLIPEVVKQEKLFGRSPEDINKTLLERDDRGILGKSFDYITKPFRYETSVFTAPVVAAIEAAQKSKGLEDFLSQYAVIAPALEKAALTNERDISVYDALRNLGLSNWLSVPLGIGADILLSPSTYTGIGGLTKLGRLAQTATRAERVGRPIAEGSKIAEQIARLSEEFGPEAANMLKLAPTAAEQADLGQRALLKFMGKPIVSGAPVFEKLSELRDLTMGSPLVSKALGTRPATIAPDTWDILKEMDRRRRGAVGLEGKELLKEVGEVAKTNKLEPDELKEVFYSLARKQAPTERLPWDKLDYTELTDPTALGALKAKHPEIVPSRVIDWEKAALEGGDTSTAFGREIIEKEAVGSRAIQEGENIISVLPDKLKSSLAKVYEAESITPEITSQFGQDWAKFTSGNDEALSGSFKKWVEKFTTDKEGWKKVPGIMEAELPSGDVVRIVGDLRFTNDAQEVVRQYAKTKFQELLDTEKSMGILNKGVDDYVPMIYEAPVKKFSFRRGGKEISDKAFFTHKKKFKNIAEAEEFGRKPVENILELVGVRSMKSAEAIEARKMLDEATELFGIVNDGGKMSMRDWGLLGKAGIDPDNKKAVAAYLQRNGYVDMKIGDKEVFFQPEIHEYLNKLVTPFTNEESFRTFLNTYDRALNVWKGYVTAINPKFHIRNFVSNLYLLFLKDGLRGLDPRVHKQAFDIGLTRKPGEIITDLGERITYDEIRSMLAKEGVMGSGFMGGELKSTFRKHLEEITRGPNWKVKLNPLKSRNVAIEAGRTFGTNVENEAKIVGFLNDLTKTGDPSLAAKRTYEHLYDYMDLSNFEKNVAKRLIPFYTWMSKNIPMMVKKLVTEPGKIGAPMAKVPSVFQHKTMADMSERGIQYPEETVPPYIKEQGAFPLGVNEKGQIPYYVPGLPYTDLSKLSIPELASALTPALKPLAEWMPKGGYSIFMDRPFESYKDQMTEAPLGSGLLPQFLQRMLNIREQEQGTYMPGETAAIINTLLPMLRTPQKLINAWRTPGTGKYVYPSELLGQKVLTVDPATERRATMYEWLRKIEDSKKVEKGIERREGKKTVEQKGTPIPLQDLIKLHSLRYGPRGVLFK